jgi:hypothetical protein
MVTGWLIFGVFVAVIMLRATALPEARLAGGILLMAFGIWLVWAAVSHSRFTPFIYAPQFLPIFFGLWLIVKGALRFAAY